MSKTDTHTLTPMQAYGHTILLRCVITHMHIAIETGVQLPIGFLQQVGKW